MKGIIYKDFYLGFGLLKNLLSFIASFLIVIAVVVLMDGPFGFIIISGITIPIVGTTLLQVSVEEDEKTNFDKMQLTYPMTKDEIMLSKYLTGIIMLGVCLIINCIICFLYVHVFKTISLSAAIDIYIFASIFGLIFMSLSNFIFVLLGNKKGIVLYMIMIIVMAGGYGATSWRIDYMSILQNHMNMILTIGSVIGVLMLVGSYFASLKVYKKRYS